LLVIGLGLTAVLGSLLQERALESWQKRAAQQTTQLSMTVLGWIEESYSMLSGLDALVENSGNVDADEFLNAVDGMESRAKINFMPVKAMFERRDGAWRVRYSSASLTADPLYPSAGSAPATVLAQTLERAQDVPNEWVMSPPFPGADGKMHVYVVVVSTAKAGVALGGVFDLGRELENLSQAGLVEGLHLDLTLKAEGSAAAIEVLKAKPVRPVRHQTHTALYTARANLDLNWQVTDDFDGGPDRNLGLWVWGGGALSSFLLAFFVAYLLRQNRNVQRQIEAATRELGQSNELKGEVATISLALQRAASPGECGSVLLSQLAERIACRQGMLAVVGGDGRLGIATRYGTSPNAGSQSSEMLEAGLVGQCARDRQAITLKLPADEAWRIRSGLGDAPPAEVRLYPVETGGELVGVLEVGTLTALDPMGQDLLMNVLPALGLRLADLLRRSPAATAGNDSGAAPGHEVKGAAA